jgi:hypothetical protein
MSRPKTWKLSLIVMAACMVFGVQGAPAKNLSPKQLQAACKKAGGVYSPPSAGGTYACLTQGGSFTVCDGHVPKGHKYCESYRTVRGGTLSNWQMRRILRSR